MGNAKRWADVTTRQRRIRKPGEDDEGLLWRRNIVDAPKKDEAMPLPPLPSWFVYFILSKLQMELSAHCTLRGDSSNIAKFPFSIQHHEAKFCITKHLTKVKTCVTRVGPSDAGWRHCWELLNFSCRRHCTARCMRSSGSRDESRLSGLASQSWWYCSAHAVNEFMSPCSNSSSSIHLLIHI